MEEWGRVGIEAVYCWSGGLESAETAENAEIKTLRAPLDGVRPCQGLPEVHYDLSCNASWPRRKPLGGPAADTTLVRFQNNTGGNREGGSWVG
jgi:hypothetical protein